MVIVDTKPRRHRTNSGSSPPSAEREPLRSFKQRSAAAPACSLCRKNSVEVTFVITDPAGLNNICERCADECVRVFVCTCVC